MMSMTTYECGKHPEGAYATWTNNGGPEYYIDGEYLETIVVSSKEIAELICDLYYKYYSVAESLRKEEKVQYTADYKLYGCSSSNCLIVKPKGMHHGGKCRCTKATLERKIFNDKMGYKDYV